MITEGIMMIIVKIMIGINSLILFPSLFVLLFGLLSKNFHVSNDQIDVLIFFLLISFTTVMTLITLYKKSKGSSDLISLYFKRKRVEQEFKINTLEKTLSENMKN